MASELICASHYPVQHRDGKEPWCKTCGLNYIGLQPLTLIVNLEDLELWNEEEHNKVIDELVDRIEKAFDD